ncbi:MAG: SIR2 family protein [Chloroflexi bacterium]|nr:SIR2 family protein [Chloroflexota bacterium]
MSESTNTDLVVLVGNGLSIAVNPDLRLDVITQRFLEHHASDRVDLDRLLAEVRLGDLDPSADFEGVVAGLEAATEVIAAFLNLASRSSHPDLRDAAELLTERGITGLVRRLYYAYCAEILSAIGEGARVTLPADVERFGAWLRNLYRAHQRMGVFTLNYDLLLERIFISDDLLRLGPAVTDFFSGLDPRTEQVTLVAGAPSMTGRLYYPEDPPPRPIQLHHLHGCLTHFRRESDGAVLKFDSVAIRDGDVYGRLAVAEASDFSPSVILGSRKVAKSREWPFAYAFLELEQRARSARTVVVAGYSFRDEAVNVRLQAAARGAERRWIVINQKAGAEAEAFRAVVDGWLAPARPEYVLHGFGGDLPEAI